MNLEQLKKILINGESETLEFKKSTAQLQSAFTTVCAFLNGKGGMLFFGVTDDKKIIGQEISDKTRIEIGNEFSKIEPPANIDVKYISIKDNKYVIGVFISYTDHAPYVYDGRPYYRNQSRTERMPQHLYDQLLLRRNQLNYSWETVKTEYDINLLDQNIILYFVRSGVESKRLPEICLQQGKFEILKNLKLIRDNKIIQAAVVLFGTEFMPEYPQCQLRLARFKGVDRSEFIDSDIVHGNFYELLEKGIFFCKKHLPIAAKIVPDKLARVETPLIPFKAIREALINALCHKDYSAHGGSIGLAIYDNRMEIANHGGLLPGMTVEQIKTGFSKLRNPIIAEVLYRSNLIEKLGRGIKEILIQCENAGDPEPQFITNDLEFKVVFDFPHTIAPPIVEDLNVKLDIHNLTARQREILSIIAAKEHVKLKEILSSLSLRISARTLRRELNMLQQLQLINSKGNTSDTVWFIKQ